MRDLPSSTPPGSRLRSLAAAGHPPASRWCCLCVSSTSDARLQHVEVRVVDSKTQSPWSRPECLLHHISLWRPQPGMRYLHELGHAPNFQQLRHAYETRTLTLLLSLSLGTSVVGFCMSWRGRCFHYQHSPCTCQSSRMLGVLPELGLKAKAAANCSVRK